MRPRRQWSRVGTVVAGSLLATSLAAGCSTSGGDAAQDCDGDASTTRSVSVDGVDRPYEVYEPASTSASDPSPVIVLVHGFGSTGAEVAAKTGLSQSGPEAGVTVVAPQAEGAVPSWQVFDGFDRDVAYVDALIAEVAASPCVADDEVWLAGFSAGSGFVGLYGCQRAEATAGMVLVAGLPISTCGSSGTPRVVIANGNDDAVVLGDIGSGPNLIARQWASDAGCSPTADEVALTSDVRSWAWTSCERGGPVDLLEVDGGGHAWPGSLEPLSLGRTTQTLSTSCVVLGLVAAPGADVASLAPGCPGEG